MTADLTLGLMLGYWGAQPQDATGLVVAAEDCGYRSVWTAEAYGSDVVSPLA
jgi:alkanesulfonate monooxygenase SsuD/methylene tetrahydromethanopterin reductase-like flavin-dependent oxidoreductase (luciferase family)